MWYTVYCGDSNQLMNELEESTVDMIITDPPYLKKFTKVYDFLFEHAARLLKPRGNLITLCGHKQLPHVISKGSEYLRFWWPLWMTQTKLNRGMIGAGVAVRGKPAVWFLKDRRLPYPEYGMPFDTLPSNLSGDNEAKKLHKWGQDWRWFAHYIAELTKEGDTILDPFCGSGSVGVACRYLNRNFIGMDIEKEFVDTTIKRIAEFNIGD